MTQYNVQLLQESDENDFDRRLRFGAIIEKINDEQNFASNICFLMKLHFT